MTHTHRSWQLGFPAETRFELPPGACSAERRARGGAASGEATGAPGTPEAGVAVAGPPGLSLGQAEGFRLLPVFLKTKRGETGVCDFFGG